MRIRLTHKFAEAIDGVDLRSRRIGDTFDLPDADAHLLIAEQWAVERPPPRRREPRVRDAASDRPDDGSENESSSEKPK